MYPFRTGRIFITFTLLLGHCSVLGDVYFHKIKDRKTLSRSHNNLNTTDYNTDLTENFSILNELHNV
jgi:hypothetical protein